MQQAFTTSTVQNTARRYWQMSLVRGVLAIIAGIIIIVWPHLAFSLFFIIFGAFAIAEGLLLIWNGYLQHTRTPVGAGAYQQPMYYQSSASTAHPTSTTTEKGQTSRKAATSSMSSTDERTSTYEPESTVEETVSERTEPASRRATSAGAGTSYQKPSASYGTGLASQMPFGQSLIGAGSTTQVVTGVLSVICGILCLVLPVAVGALVIFAVAAWAMFRGISMLVESPERGWMIGLVGVLALILSLFLFIDPIGAIRGFLWGVGVFLLIAGVLMVARAIQHNLASAHAHPATEPTY